VIRRSRTSAIRFDGLAVTHSRDFDRGFTGDETRITATRAAVGIGVNAGWGKSAVRSFGPKDRAGNLAGGRLTGAGHRRMIDASRWGRVSGSDRRFKLTDSREVRAKYAHDEWRR
jgi:hypothetical protein